MLVLTRKPQQTIWLTVPPSNESRRIKITLVEVNLLRCSGRIGIEAGDDVEILREELIANTPEDLDGI